MRPSRSYPLETLLGPFALNEAADHERLHALLAAAAARLGPPESDDTFAEPRLMARYALNLTDPANWSSVDGGRAYISPPEEARHIEALQEKHAAHTQDVQIDAAIQGVLEDSTRSSHEFAEQAVAYTQRLSTVTDSPEDVLRSRTNAIVSAAMVLSRDGSDRLLDQHEEWARNVFAPTFATTNHIAGSGGPDGIRFNPVAIATLGLIHLWQRRGREGDCIALLELAGREDSLAAHGFGGGITVLREIDPRLASALLRCALTAQVQPSWVRQDTEEIKATKQAQHKERVAGAIQAELAWLNNVGPEPTWPIFPPPMISVQRGLRIGGNDHAARRAPAVMPSDQLHSQRAATWIKQLTRDSGPDDLDCIVSFVDAYADWTAAANGAGHQPEAKIEGRMGEWNSVFFSLLARAFAAMTPDQVATHVARSVAVPDESFFDVANELVRMIDQVHFNGSGLDIDMAVRLRSLLADRLVQTAGWRRECDSSELSVEMHIGSAIAALFFNNYSLFTGSSCDLLAKGIDQVEPFLPELSRLITDGPVPFTGLLTMSLLEVSPRSAHLSFFLSSSITWIKRQPTNTQLWIDVGLGTRVAKWLETVFGIDATLRDPSHPLRSQMEDVLARLVQAGVADAHRVEGLLV